MRRGFQILTSMVILLVLITGCTTNPVSTNGTEGEMDNPIPVEVAIVTNENTSLGKTYSGSFAPAGDHMIVAKFASKILSLSVNKGDVVKEGQLLATLDTKDLENQVKQAKAQLESANANYNQSVAGRNANIAQAELSVQNAQRTYDEAKKQAERMKNLKDSGAISTSEWEQAENAFRQAEGALKLAREQLATAKGDAGLKAAQAGVNQAKVAYETAQRSLADSRILSPIDGEVAEIHGDVGEMVSPSAPFIRVIDRTEMVFTFPVWEQDLPQLKKEMQVEIEVPSLKKNVSGTIRYIGIAPLPNSKTYPVEVAVKNEESLLYPGMSGNAKLSFTTAAKQLVVPNEALVDQGGKRYVYLVSGDTVHLTEVAVETLDSNRSIVKAGLKERDQVVTKGKYSVKDKAKITVLRGNGE